MPTVRISAGPLGGLVAQVALLATLAGTVGVSPVGWLAGLTYGLVLAGVLDHAGAGPLGPADRVTLGRAVLVGGVTALVADGLAALVADDIRPAPTPVLVTLTCVALSLDWVDGQVARRTGTTSPFGARFDMEIDAFLIFVLSAHLAGIVGPWVLGIGAMRYVFVTAMWVLPWLRGTLPPRYWRKVVAAIQGVTLVTAASGVLPGPAAAVTLALALALLAGSFGRDVWWLWRHRPAPRRSPRWPTVRLVRFDAAMKFDAAVKETRT